MYDWPAYQMALLTTNFRCIQSYQYFTPAEGFDLAALEGNPNPFGTETEREIATRKKELPVYRMLFRRNYTPYGGGIEK